jgi:TatD DNase family protein
MKLKIFDTHAHLNLSDFDKDRYEVIKRCLDNNVWMINVGTDYKDSQKAVEIAEKYDEGVFAAIGQHPSVLDEKFDFENFEKLAKSSSKVKAIGEIGLDYKYKPENEKEFEIFKQKQKELVLEQIKLARKIDLPVIFHCRMAHNDLMKILDGSRLRGVIHSFTGTWGQAKKYLDMGFYLGFNGIIFRKIKGISFEEVIKNAPIDKILVETDCPFLTPPQEGSKINEPMFVKHTIQRIAEIRELPFDKIAKITFENARKLFKV